MCCKCCSRKIPKDCQFNTALARAVFIDICCSHHCIRKQKDRDIQNHYPGQALGSCTLCVSVCPSWSTRATRCCTSSKHRRSPLSSLAPFPQIHFQATQLSVTHPHKRLLPGWGVHLQYIGDSNLPVSPGTVWTDPGPGQALGRPCPSQKEPASPFTPQAALD